MENKKLYFYLYVLLWALYFLQGTLYESGSSISQGILTITILISGIFMLKVLKRPIRPSYINVVSLILLLATVYGITLLLSGDKSGTQWNIFLKEYYCSLLPIYVFYMFTKRGVIQQKELNVFSYIFITVTILFYFKQYYEVSENLNKEEVTNNSGYMFIPLISLLPLMKIKRIFKYFLLIVLAAFVLFAAKRGAIVSFVVCVAIFLYYQVEYSTNRTKIITFALSTIILIAGYHYSMMIIENDAYLTSRLDDTLAGNSSSRDYIYNKLIDHVKDETSLVDILFGHGANGTRMIAGRLAHNDWLEIFIDMGFWGFFIYIYYWVTFYKTRKKMLNSNQIQAITIIIVFCLVRSLFSMSINDMYIVTTFVIGYCVAQAELNRLQQNRDNFIIKK